MIMTRKYIAEYKQKEHFSFTSGGMTSDIVGNQSFSMTKDLMLARDSVVIIGGKKKHQISSHNYRMFSNTFDQVWLLNKVTKIIHDLSDTYLDKDTFTLNATNS